ncbi:MAG: tetratricopeptide repeat protein, partial [Pseudomonadota bacterium]
VLNLQQRARRALRTLVLGQVENPPASVAHRTTAWTVLGHASFERADFAESERAYTAVLQLDSVDEEQYEALYERLAASVYKQGESRREAGDLAGAVEDFLRVARVTPASTIVATAEYDAAAALVQLEDWSRAADVFERFRVEHADNPLANNVTRELAGVYLNAGRDADAAVELDRIAGDASLDLETRTDAIAQSASLYQKAGDVAGERAAIDYRLNALGASLDETIDLRERLAELALADDDVFARNAQLREIISVHARADAPTERSRSAAASASMTLADEELGAYMAIRLVVPLAESLRAKKASMEGLLDAYGEAADYGVGPVTTAATFRIG